MDESEEVDESVEDEQTGEDEQDKSEEEEEEKDEDGKEEDDKECVEEEEEVEQEQVEEDKGKKGGKTKKLMNQFNFCERGSLTYNNPYRVSVEMFDDSENRTRYLRHRINIVSYNYLFCGVGR